jgi:hypothetical protein
MKKSSVNKSQYTSYLLLFSFSFPQFFTSFTINLMQSFVHCSYYLLTFFPTLPFELNLVPIFVLLFLWEIWVQIQWVLALHCDVHVNTFLSCLSSVIKQTNKQTSYKNSGRLKLRHLCHNANLPCFSLTLLKSFFIILSSRLFTWLIFWKKGSGHFVCLGSFTFWRLQ